MKKILLKSLIIIFFFGSIAGYVAYRSGASQTKQVSNHETKKPNEQTETMQDFDLMVSSKSAPMWIVKSDKPEPVEKNSFWVIIPEVLLPVTPEKNKIKIMPSSKLMPIFDSSDVKEKE